MKKILFFILMCIPVITFAAGFDCSKAATNVEHMVCNDTRLSNMDEKISAAYKELLSSSSQPDAIKAEQKKWISDVRNKCTVITCLYSAYSDRLNQLLAYNQSVKNKNIEEKQQEEIKNTPLEDKDIQTAFDGVIKSDRYTIRSACEAVINCEYILCTAENHRLDLLNSCTSKVTDKITALKASYANKTFDSCRQWAIANGLEWVNAELGMQYSPLSQKNTPVKFSGEIVDGNNEALLVYYKNPNRDLYSNAMVNISTDTIVIRREQIKISANTKGYGLPVGSQNITLVSGQQTTAPVIDAKCIESD